MFNFVRISGGFKNKFVQAPILKLTSDKLKRQASRGDNMSYKVIIELEYENKPNVENVLEYIEELGTDLDYKLINNSKQQASRKDKRW